MKLLNKLGRLALAGMMAVTTQFASPAAVFAEETTGEFTVCSMNVDGLPNKILFVNLNPDGPGSDGTKKISAKMNEYQWDIIGVSEDFNYNTELLSSLKNYNSGTHRGGVSGLSNNTDGLNLLWKNTINVTGEKWTHWTTNYSTGIANTGNGADGMIDKGFRYYQAEIAPDVKVDVYILHMDADSDQGDIDAREAQIVQLRNTIIASDNKNPIIVMGDTNCRYTREHLETSFIGELNKDPRFTAKDAWIEHIYNGVYPVYGSDAIVAVDKGGTYEYPQAEIVDKIFYINNTDSDITLTSNNYVVNTDFVGSDGKALADHWPISVNFTYTKKTAAHTHQYTVSVKDAACTEDGVKTYTCECGDSYTETIPATGHSYTETVVDSTCTSEGYKQYTCSKCGDTYIGSSIAMKEHTWTLESDPPTCTEEGKDMKTCDICGAKEVTAVPATGHIYDDDTCTVCGYQNPSLHTHQYELSDSSDATCTEDGVKTYTCVCGDSYTDITPAKGHKYQASVVAPTCTAGGYTVHTCSVCKDQYVTDQTAPVSHTYVNGECSVCGAKDPDYKEPEVPSDTVTYKLGSVAEEITSGKKYGIVFESILASYTLKHTDGKVTNGVLRETAGQTIDEDMIWTVEETDGGYTISAVVDGTVKYLARTKTLTNSGYKLTVQDTAFTWKHTTTSTKTHRFTTSIVGKNYYLRYYSKSTGFIVSTQSAGVKLYEVNEK